MAIDIMRGSVEEHAGQEQPAKLTPEQTREQAIVQEAIENFAFVDQSVEAQQRKQEDEDLEFEGGDQWPQGARDAREKTVDEVTGEQLTPRPIVTINLVDQPIQQVMSEARQARLSLTVKPKAGLANTKTAGFYKGLIRAIQADSGAQAVRLWALERAAKCGRGAYEIRADFANDGDFDLDLIIAMILNQSTVYWDPYRQSPDCSDAEWCLITDWMSEDERRRRWPRNPIIPTDGAFESSDHPWFAHDETTNKNSVRIARYYKVTYEKRVLAYHPDTGSMPLDQMPPEIQARVNAKHPGTRMREPETRRVTEYILDGSQVLETHPWMGRYIPVIPVTGKEYNIKGKRSWKGITTNMKDIGRAYNVTMSAAIQEVGSMQTAKYIMYAGQDEGFETMWDDSAIKNFARLYINPTMIGDKPAPFPQRQSNEPQIQGLMLLAKVLRDDVGSVVGSVDPIARAVNPHDRSGKAIEALQRQGAAGTSNYLDNLATISMMQEGRILIDLIPKVYDREGRIIRVMGEENDDETAIMLKRPFVYDEEDNPVAVPCPVCQGQGQVPGPRTILRPIQPPLVMCSECQGAMFATKKNMPKEYNRQEVQYVDLSEGQFKVSVAVGRAYQTKQEEAMAMMAQLAEAAPPLVPIYADLWVRAMGFSGSTEIADRIKAQNPAAQSEKDKSAQSLPPELLQQVAQLKQEHDAAVQELQKASEIIKSDVAKITGQKEIQAMKAEAAAGLENLKIQHKILEMGMGQQGSKEMEALRGNLEAMRLDSEQRHEVLMQLLKELGAKEQERHSVALHAQAEAEAARQLPAVTSIGTGLEGGA